jgi:hypothetical protein
MSQGFIISKDEMLSIMCRRIDFTRFIKKVDVSSVPLQTPVFVMGLPRCIVYPVIFTI